MAVDPGRCDIQACRDANGCIGACLAHELRWDNCPRRVCHQVCRFGCEALP